ncbi:hypothetical protein KR044_001270, partial [Drosophila immigrans]
MSYNVCTLKYIFLDYKLKTIVVPQEALVFRFTNAVCVSHNKSWVVINTCRLRAISRKKVVFNFNGTFLHPSNNIWLHGQIFRKANGYKPWVMNYTVDCCRFVKKSYNPFATFINSMYIDFSNFNHSCPFVGDQIIDGFYLNVNMLKGLPIPSGDYLLAMNWFFYEKKQFTTDIYYTFTEDL